MRREHLAGRDEHVHWLPSADGVLAFRRGDIVCAVNLTSAPVPLAWPGSVLVASGEPIAGRLPPDAAVWILASDPPAAIDENTPPEQLSPSKEQQR